MSVKRYFPYCNDLRDSFFDRYAKLTQEQLEWQATGSKNSIGFALRHVAQSEDWFIHDVIRNVEVPLKRKAELPTIQEILDYLHYTRSQTLQLLDTMDEAQLESVRTLGEGFRGKPRTTTVHWILHRVFEHEAYHYGQVNLLMRQMGLEPPQM